MINFNTILTANVNRLIEKFHLPNTIIAAIIGASLSSVKYKRADKSQWLLTEAAALALYFGEPLDALTFNDRDFVVKENKKYIVEMKKNIKQHLIDTGATNTLGKLTAEKFFND